MQRHTETIKHINQQWDALTCLLPCDKETLLGLPNPFICPSKNAFANNQFYWDSYFTVLGLVLTEKKDLAKGMVDNLLFLFDRFGLVPSRNTYYNVGGSQIPFLTSMIKEVHKIDQDDKWLHHSLLKAEKEYQSYWMNHKEGRGHLTKVGLSRYVDHYIIHETAEHESGWDMTSRFNEECLDIIPIDLNACLYVYETDLEKHYEETGALKLAQKYKNRADKRRHLINTHCWDSKDFFFFDYNHRTKRRMKFFSLAAYYTLWAKLATKKQAEHLVRHLSQFLCDGGLANTQSHKLLTPYKQWDYPNGWPNQQYIVIRGLLNYGYKKEALLIANRWTAMVTNVFKKTGKIWEKYDVVRRTKGKDARYPTQSGFGWTNATFLRILHEIS